MWLARGPLYLREEEARVRQAKQKKGPCTCHSTGPEQPFGSPPRSSLAWCLASSARMSSQKAVTAPYPLIDSDPHAFRVVRYFRPSDYATVAAGTAAFPAALYFWSASKWSWAGASND